MPYNNLQKKKEHNKKYRELHKQYFREYFKNWCKKFPHYFIPYRKKYILNNPIKYKARYTLTNAVRLGKIIRPKNCSKCNSLVKIEAHHEDYSKPLEVIWLCKKCHLML